MPVECLIYKKEEPEEWKAKVLLESYKVGNSRDLICRPVWGQILVHLGYNTIVLLGKAGLLGGATELGKSLVKENGMLKIIR